MSLLYYPTWLTALQYGILLPTRLILSFWKKFRCLHLKYAPRNGPASYTFLLTYSQLPSLSARRSQSKLILLFKFLHKLTYLPPNLLFSAPTPTKDLRSYHPLNLITIFHRTTAGSIIPSPHQLLSYGTLFHLTLKRRLIYHHLRL